MRTFLAFHLAFLAASNTHLVHVAQCHFRLTEVHGVREEDDPLALEVGLLDLDELALLDEGSGELAGV
jgi:hypothetical protein